MHRCLTPVNLISTAESLYLCYTDCNVVHVGVVHVRVVHAVVNNLIRAHYNIIMKTTEASGGKLPVHYLVTRCHLCVMVWCGHHDELTSLLQWFRWRGGQ